MLYNLYIIIKNVYIGLILLAFVILFFIVLNSNSSYKSNINDIKTYFTLHFKKIIQF